jgi:hypothetical protein
MGGIAVGSFGIGVGELGTIACDRVRKVARWCADIVVEK